MKLGSKIFLTLVFFFIYVNNSITENQITTTPLINIDEIKPSFEEPDQESENVSSKQNLKEKKKKFAGKKILFFCFKIIFN